jgi:hypothetical protein
MQQTAYNLIIRKSETKINEQNAKNHEVSQDNYAAKKHELSRENLVTASNLVRKSNWDQKAWKLIKKSQEISPKGQKHEILQGNLVAVPKA